MADKIKFSVDKVLNEIEVQIIAKHSAYNPQLVGFKNIKAFFQQEYDFWVGVQEPATPFKDYIDHNNKAVEMLTSFHDECSSIGKESELISQWENIKKILQKDNVTGTQKTHPIFYSHTPEGQLIFDALQVNRTQGIAAYNYLREENQKLNNRDDIIGFIKAYELDHQDTSKIPQRRKLEKQTLNRIRKKWEKNTNDVIQDFTEKQIALDNWKNDFISDFKQWESDKIADLEQIKINGEIEIVTLKNKYIADLRLRPSVEHWRKRAESFGGKGAFWATLLVVAIVSSVGLLLSLLYNAPEAFTKSLLQGDPLAVKGVIIFASIISFSAYLINLLTKLTVSAFHLMRDAEEREQLTYVYLSLKEDVGINPKEESIILQSLFSRCDTGLIKGDSSPTMPDIRSVEKMINSNSGSK
jgi:uncharacterized protein DUF6161